ncbi:O-acetylhomoserine aminocarboxypropyltransferase [Paraburkholderia haematera]|nr:O-acetylhomoserine aminocarboxypropyltransferase [Paraburkholderia haematera]
MSANRFDTLALHAGAAPDPTTGARATPIYQTTSFSFRDSDHAAALFNMERAGHVYSRISNPTVAVFEERVAALESGAGAIGTASGQAALHLAIATLMGAGSHIVASSALYGGSHNLLHYTLRRFGIETTFVKPGDPDAWRAALRPNTRLLFGETLGNPGLDVLDIATVAQLAHEHRVPLLVDSTFTTPYLLKPFEHGADFVYHSATKFLGGHGTTIGGVLVDGGTFDFDASGRFPEFTEPYEGFHGMVFAEESTVAPFLLRARREGLRDFGACLHPQAAWQLLQGIETLPLRMERHVANTRKVVEFLCAHPAVEAVAYPELPSHPDHALAKRMLPRGAGAVFSFNLRGDRAAGRSFIEALSLFSHLANVGDARSLVIHPASTTHFRMDAAALAAAGIAEGTIRLSIGLEDPDDLIDDLKRALKAAQKASGTTAPRSGPSGPSSAATHSASSSSAASAHGNASAPSADAVNPRPESA